jgi:hypothetical protein
MYFMKVYERIVIQQRGEDSERKRKADERKSKSGGKNYTHNVKG